MNRPAFCLLLWFTLTTPACDPAVPRRDESPAMDRSGETESRPASRFQPLVPRREATRADEPVFGGIESILAGEDWVELRWSAARTASGEAAPDAAYAVYVSLEAGQQDFARPFALTRETRYRMTALETGVTLYLVVRAQSGGQEDGNRDEWSATPYPVRYIRADSPGGDGLRPATASASLQDAIEHAIALEGVNFHVAGGRYRERVFLFDGSTIYGGFAADFDPATRDPERFPTVLESAFEKDLVLVAPGRALCGMDGVTLEGSGGGTRGIVADDCSVQLSNVTVRGFSRKGIDLRGREDALSHLRGVLIRCEIEGNGGEGLALEGICSVWVRSSRIHDNADEGIEAEPLSAAAHRPAQLLVDRCLLARNGEVGLDVELAPYAGANSQTGFEILIQDCDFAANRSHGMRLVTRPREAPIAVDVTIQRCRVVSSGGSGVRIDSDAPGNYRILDCALVGQEAGCGVELSGDHPGTVVGVADCWFRNNSRDLRVRAEGDIRVENSILEGAPPDPVEGSSREEAGVVYRDCLPWSRLDLSRPAPRLEWTETASGALAVEPRAGWRLREWYPRGEDRPPPKGER